VANQGDQWIELFNPGPANADLSGWTLRSGANGTVYRFPQGTTVRKGTFLMLYGKQTALVFSETGGTLSLLNPAGAVIETVTYPALATNISYSRDQAGRWSTSPTTPGTPNMVLIPATPGGPILE
jgi:hypothetical protein